jgi:YhcH/YjgK/YiaL family protein
VSSDISSDNFKLALDYISKNDFIDVPLGKTILSDGVYFNVEEYETKNDSDCVFESHIKYCDIQIVVKGSEAIGYTPLINYSGNITIPYNIDKDIVKYHIDNYEKIILNENEGAIFFPSEIHGPKMKNENSSFVKKVVFKIKL